MSKIIVIGELGVDILMDGAAPRMSRPAGRLLNAACILGRRGLPVEMVGDMGSDPMGDIVMNYLREAGVGVTSVDRYTDGLTPVNFYFGERVERYVTTPADGLDVVWPRIEPGDVVLYGGFYAIDPRVRSRLLQLLTHLYERKCTLIYLPGFMSMLAPRVTRVMPAIIENMEMASMIVTRPGDLVNIYGKDGQDMDRCYKNHLFYYTQSMVNVDAPSGKVTHYQGRTKTETSIAPGDASLEWMARFVADVAERVYRDGCQ